jgi:hypothetical protein
MHALLLSSSIRDGRLCSKRRILSKPNAVVIETIKLQPGSNLGCQMDVLQRETNQVVPSLDLLLVFPVQDKAQGILRSGKMAGVM